MLEKKNWYKKECNIEFNRLVCSYKKNKKVGSFVYFWKSVLETFIK